MMLDRHAAPVQFATLWQASRASPTTLCRRPPPGERCYVAGQGSGRRHMGGAHGAAHQPAAEAARTGAPCHACVPQSSLPAEPAGVPILHVLSSNAGASSVWMWQGIKAMQQSVVGQEVMVRWDQAFIEGERRLSVQEAAARDPSARLSGRWCPQASCSQGSCEAQCSSSMRRVSGTRSGVVPTAQRWEPSVAGKLH